MQFEYFYDRQEMQYAFYRIPKMLFQDKCFLALSTDAKLLYGILIDRMELSSANGWKDSKGRIYVYCPIEEIRKIFQCGNDKAIKLLKELDAVQGIGLIEVARRGKGKPNQIYLMDFSVRKEKVERGGDIEEEI